jgi:hypothetical protein
MDSQIEDIKYFFPKGGVNSNLCYALDVIVTKSDNVFGTDLEYIEILKNVGISNLRARIDAAEFSITGFKFGINYGSVAAEFK